MSSRKPGVLVLATMLALLTACSHTSTPKDTPTAKEPPVAVRDEQELRTSVADLAARIHAQVAPHGTLTEFANTSYGCENSSGTAEIDGQFHVQGTFTIGLPSTQHRATLQHLADEWKTAGWTDVQYRTFGTNGLNAEVKGTQRGSGPAVDLASSEKPNTLGLMVTTPCYTRASGANS